MNIRIATPEDAGQLLNIYSYYVEYTAITFEYQVPSREEFTRRIIETLKHYPYIVAEENGRIVGYAYAGRFKARAAYDWCVETSIYVDRDKRESGVGSALLTTLEGLLKKQNIINVNACISVPKDNEDEYLTFGSEAFHEKKGYRLVGTFHECGYKFHRWYNMIWMEKMLGDHTSHQPNVIPFTELRKTLEQ